MLKQQENIRDNEQSCSKVTKRNYTTKNDLISEENITDEEVTKQVVKKDFKYYFNRFRYYHFRFAETVETTIAVGCLWFIKLWFWLLYGGGSDFTSQVHSQSLNDDIE